MLSETCKFSLTANCKLDGVNSKFPLSNVDRSSNSKHMQNPDNNYQLRSVRLEPAIVAALGLDKQHLPLEENLIFKGSDFDRAGAAVSSVSVTRTFEPLSKEPDPFIELRRARLRYGEIGLTYNNVETRLRTPGPTNYYSLAIPLSGSQVSVTDSGEVTTRPPNARLHSAGSIYDIRRSTDYVAIIASLSAAGFEHFVGDRIHFLTAPKGAFNLRLDMCGEQFAVFTSILGTLLRSLGERGNDRPQGDIVISRLEEAMWFAFVDACPEFYEEFEQARKRGTISDTVDRVTTFIDENVEKELTLSDLIAVSGVSARTLYSGFSQAYGTGPMAYLKLVKLNRCRESLLAADPKTEFVGDIAAVWGFYHLSSFARYYKQEFGELPSETLKLTE